MATVRQHQQTPGRERRHAVRVEAREQLDHVAAADLARAGELR
jgi:hypothetical protein